MMTVGNATGRVRTTYQDKWGRWVSQKFQGKAGVTFTIISAYQVVTDTPSKGVTTAAAQQQSFLIQEQDAITAPRVAFRRDLSRYLHSCRKQGEEILLMGDFNEQIGLDLDLMQKLMEENELVDVMTAQHSTSLPTTYARGQRCLDYALSAAKVLQAVRRAGYEAFNARYPTDHRSYYVDLATDHLFGIQIQPLLAKLEPRVLKSNNLQQVTAYYIRTKHKYLQQHNVFERILNLERAGNRHQHPERIDKTWLPRALLQSKRFQDSTLRIGQQNSPMPGRKLKF